MEARRSNGKKSSANKKLNRIVLTLSLIIIVCAVFYIVFTDIAPFSTEPASTSTITTKASTSLEEMSVMIIDVGQGDSVLVAFGSDDVMLIDAGESSSAESVEEELDERGITQIDVLVATHPHTDHIGGMTEIINDYDIGCVYMPDMQSDTKTYQKLMDSIENKTIPIVEAYAGESFELGGAYCTIVSPDKSDDKDANNESVMILLDYIDTEFLFTGDAEEWAEERILSAGYNIDADVLKVAHHGSSTGTSEAFLQAVSPDYAVISCGEDNEYGHPHEETLELLDEYNIDTLRTDTSGDVLFISDGYSLKTILGD